MTDDHVLNTDMYLKETILHCKFTNVTNFLIWKCTAFKLFLRSICQNAPPATIHGYSTNFVVQMRVRDPKGIQLFQVRFHSLQSCNEISGTESISIILHAQLQLFPMLLIWNFFRCFLEMENCHRSHKLRTGVMSVPAVPKNPLGRRNTRIRTCNHGASQYEHPGKWGKM